MSRWSYFLLAAFCEIAGCYAFWAWARLGRPVWWLGWGTLSLLMFAWALTRIDNSFAARTFAAYGGVYVFGALLWLVLVEGARPDRWDLLGVGLCLLGTLVILLGPR